MDYKRMTAAELRDLAAQGEYGAALELRRRESRRGGADTKASRTDRYMSEVQNPRPTKGAKKAEREAKWSPKKKAFVERARKVMSYAYDLMADKGWYPGEAIRAAWAAEKSGKLAAYVPKSRGAAPDSVKGLFKNNPYDYGYPF